MSSLSVRLSQDASPAAMGEGMRYRDWFDMLIGMAIDCGSSFTRGQSEALVIAIIHEPTPSSQKGALMLG